MRKFTSTLLSLVMVFSIFSPSVLAEGVESTDSLLESVTTSATTSDEEKENKAKETTTSTDKEDTTSEEPKVNSTAIETDVEESKPEEKEEVETTETKNPEVIETDKESPKEEVTEEGVEEEGAEPPDNTVTNFVDRTGEVIKDGVHVFIRYSEFGGASNYVPTFTLVHRTAKGEVISEVVAGPQNYNKEKGEYNLVFKNPGYKLGEEYQLYLKDADSVVTQLKMVVQYFEGDNLITQDTTLKKDNYFTFKVREVAYYEGENDETAVKGLEPSNLFPLMGELSTNANKVGFILKTSNGAPLKNETIYVKSSGKWKEPIKLTSNNNGVACIDKDKLSMKFLVYSDTKKVAGSAEDKVTLSFYGSDIQDGIFTYELVLEDKKSESQSSIDINVKVDGSTDLSSSWVSADLDFKDSKGNITTFTVNGKNEKFSLADGTYTVTSKSEYANIKLGATTVTVKNGKGSLNVTLSPKYTLHVDKEGGSYSFKVLNISALESKVFSGKNALVYGVTPGESYIIEDTSDSKTYTVVIEKDSPVTKLLLGVGVVYGGEATAPHTGDNIIFLVIFFFVTLIAAGVSFFIYNKNKRVKNTVLSVLLIGTLLSGLIPMNAGQVFSASSGIGSGTPGHTSGGSSTPTDVIQTSKTISLLQVSFTNGISNDKQTQIYAGSKIADFMDRSRFSNARLRNTFYMAPNKQVYDLFKSSSSSFAVFENGTMIPIYGNTNMPTSKNANSAFNRSHFGITGSMSSRLLPLPEDAVKSANGFEYFVGKMFMKLSQNPSNSRHIWYGESSSSSMNVGDAINTEWTEEILKRFQATGEYAEIDSNMVHLDILNGYMEKLTAIGQTKLVEELTDDLNEAVFKTQQGITPYVFLFQVVQGFQVKGKSAYTFMPMNDAVEWYLYGRQKQNPSKFSKYTYMKEAEVVYGISGDNGGPASNYWSKMTPANTYVYNVRKTSAVAVKPRSSNVPIIKPATSAKSLQANPFAGWGFVPWNMKFSFTAKPKLKMQLKIHEIDEATGELTGNVVTKDIPIPKDGITGDDKDSNLSDGTPLADIKTDRIKGSTTVQIGKDVYTIQPQKDSFITLIDMATHKDSDPKYGKESLLKLDAQGINFKMTTSTKGVETLPLPVPTYGNDSWEIAFKQDIPSAISLLNYLGGDSKLKGETNKYSGKRLFSDALLTLNVKAVKEPFEPPLNSNASVLVVPEWRLTKYFDDISPTRKEKAGFSLALPISTFDSPSLTNSGNTKFNLIDPKLDKIPWAISKAKLFNDTPYRDVNVYSYVHKFNLAGDLLAVKDNSTVMNTKLASWKNNYDLLNKRIGVTTKGVPESKPLIQKHHIFDYSVKSPYSTYIYSELRVKCDKNSCWKYTWSGDAPASYAKTNYNTTVNFNRYVPSKSVEIKKFAKEDDKVTNGFYWEAYQDKTQLNINPEVLMSHDDVNGNTSVVYTAGDQMRQIQPVHYNTAKYINVAIKPKVDGASVATDTRAKQLASKLGAGGLGVIYKGSAITSNFTVKGELELKTYALDIGSSALKNNWGNSDYSANKVNEEFLSRYGTKQADGKWQITMTADGKLKINGKDYAGKKDDYKLLQKSANVKEHTLVVRGGKLLSINGNTNIAGLDKELKDALERMKISTDVGENIFNTFEREKGAKLTESNFASLGNKLRGVNDLAVDKPWYNEDTTTLVIREFTNVFDLPQHMYVDKLPMEIDNKLKAPVDKNKFFSEGYVGYTKLRFNVGDAFMEYDASLAKPFGGEYTKLYVVPNVSVLDSFNQ